MLFLAPQPISVHSESESIVALPYTTDQHGEISGCPRPSFVRPVCDPRIFDGKLCMVTLRPTPHSRTTLIHSIFLLRPLKAEGSFVLRYISLSRRVFSDVNPTIFFGQDWIGAQFYSKNWKKVFSPSLVYINSTPIRTYTPYHPIHSPSCESIPVTFLSTSRNSLFQPRMVFQLISHRAGQGDATTRKTGQFPFRQTRTEDWWTGEWTDEEGVLREVSHYAGNINPF